MWGVVRSGAANPRRHYSGFGEVFVLAQHGPTKPDKLDDEVYGRGAVVEPDVQMNSVLDGLCLGYALEPHNRRVTVGIAKVDRPFIRGEGFVPECSRPEGTEFRRLVGVDTISKRCPMRDQTGPKR